MSFLEVSSELRERVIDSAIIIDVASSHAEVRIRQSLRLLSITDQACIVWAERRRLPVTGRTGNDISFLSTTTDGEKGGYVFDKATNQVSDVVQPGTSVLAEVDKDSTGQRGLLHERTPIITNNVVIPSGVRFTGRF